METRLSTSSKFVALVIFTAFALVNTTCTTLAWGQNPFSEQKLDASQDEQPAEATGSVTYSGMTINYNIAGTTNLRSRSFAKLSAWNFPGTLDLVGDPAAEKITVSGSIDVQSTGYPDTDNQNYVFQILLWGDSQAGRLYKKVVEKTVQRPFQESYSFDIPEPETYNNLSFQISFREDTGPENPLPTSVRLSFSKRPDAKSEPVKWSGATGSGSSGKVAVAVAAAALAAAAVIRRGRKKPNKNKTAGYVLQVSKDTLTLAVGESEHLEVTAWRVDETGQTALASEATIEVVPPVNLPGLQVSPLTGQGKFNISVSLTKAEERNECILLIRARAKESSFATQVKIKLGQYCMEFF